MPKRIDFTGTKKGFLTALYKDKKSNVKCAWICKCDCGNIKSISRFSDTLTRSCGCKRKIYGDLYFNKLKVKFENSYFNDPSGCWVWKGYVGDVGYGVTRLKGKIIRAHRLSWILFKGDIPKNQYVLHSCDNRKCVNPEHLFLGTQLENVKDMISKNRNPKGSKKVNALLNEKDVLVIRSLYSSNQYKQKEIANIFNVKQYLISTIINRITWKHI